MFTYIEYMSKRKDIKVRDISKAITIWLPKPWHKRLAKLAAANKKSVAKTSEMVLKQFISLDECPLRVGKPDADGNVYEYGMLFPPSKDDITRELADLMKETENE